MRKSASLCVAAATAALVGAAGLLAAGAAASGPAQTTPAAYARAGEADKYKALVTRYCIGCHNSKTPQAGISFTGVDLAALPQQAEMWERVVKKLRGRMMPPPGMPHPDESTTDDLTGWLEGYLDVVQGGAKDPGHVALHRLNRREYANAVHELLDLKVVPTALLPQDDVADGFDNVADVLQVSPTFLDQYIAAARTVAVQAVGDKAPRAASASYFAGAEDDGKQVSYVPGLPLGTRGGMVVEHNFPADGDYELNVNDMVGGLYSLNSEFSHKVLVVLDGAKVYETDVGGDEDSRQIDQLQAPAIEKINGRLKKIKFKATAGPHKLGVTFLARSFAESDARLQNFSPGGGMERVPRVTSFEVRGPFQPTGLSETPSRKKIFSCYPKKPAEEAACADKILSGIARRAYRRPINAADMTELRKFYKAGVQRAGFEEGVRGGITRILASPEFLYRVEQDPAKLPAGGIHRISDLELASRLSFFLWSNLPDDELLNLAAAGKLSNPKVLDAQIARMLADPRADTLVSSFAFQWLQVAKLDDVAPDAKIFPNVSKQRDSDGDIRAAMKEELRLFIGDIFRKDRSVIDLLTADDTYLNERLALHYGINNVKGVRFRHVKLAQQERRGLLGKGAVLMQTSYPNRTSPVLRGAWILENIVGTPPNPPPPGVEALKEPQGGETTKTMRERMAQHRANPSCNMCHGVMDPLGLSLENFDAVGVWRVRDRFAASDIDASGVLPTGAKINGPNDLRNALASRPQQFAQTFIQKMMTYALGRKLDYRDMPTVRAITAKAAADNYRFSTIVNAIVASDQFRFRAKPAAPAPAKPADKVQVASAKAPPARP
jgi:mono/diheme cytochrome c family protein